MAYRITFALILASNVLFPNLNHAAAILTADVEGLLADADNSARVPVIVRFEKEYEISKLKEEYIESQQHQTTSLNSRKHLKQFRIGVFNGLKQQTRKASASVSRLLQKHRVKTQLKILWTINGIAFNAPVDLLDEISALPGVERITSDLRLRMRSPEVEETTISPQWNIERLNATKLWQQDIFGEGVVVGIMDSGVDINHPDLSDRWRGGNNSWFDPYGEHDFPADLVGHGTQALGLILGGDESGYQVGMAPKAIWIAAKIFDDANQTTLSAIHLAFQWLLDPDGDPLTDDAPHLVNNSWGFASTINQCYQEFDEDIRLLQASGIGVIFAAGNYGPSLATSISPANNPGSLSVGSVDQLDEIELLSSRGPSACDGGIYPRLVAPGGLVFTTDLLPVAYNVVSGTSFAAPHITGAMALLKSAFPDLPVSQIETALYDSAVDLGQSGADDQFGYGLADVFAAYNQLLSDFGTDEQSQLRFNEPQYSVDETTQHLIVTVRRIGGHSDEVSVDYTTRDDVARSGHDYIQQSGHLTFVDGESLRSFEIPIINDRQDEENESFRIVLNNVKGNAILGDQDEAVVVIRDDDGRGSIAFSTLSTVVNEAREKALITLLRTGGTSGNAVVSYQTIADTAIAEGDFIAAEGTARFHTGEREKQITIDLIDDQQFEGSERFQVLITELDGEATIGRPAAITVTILDDDPNTYLASISLEAVRYEVNENSRKLSMNIIREGNLDSAVSVNYSTLDGSAKQHQDYLPASGTITFAEGSRRGHLSIDILDDTIYEQESSFTLILSNASSGAVISNPATAIIRIRDNDALPFVSIQSPTTRTSGNLIESQQSSQLDINRSLGKREQLSGSAELKIIELNLRNYAEATAPHKDVSNDIPKDSAQNTKSEGTDESGQSSCESENRTNSASIDCVPGSEALQLSDMDESEKSPNDSEPIN
jgi:bacillopeptidase F